MKHGIFIFSFIVSIGLTAFGLMTAYRMKQRGNTSFASSLFYYDAFLAAFGFYSIWSFLGVKFLLNHVISSPETLLNVVAIFPFLGFPLLLVAWYLFIQLCFELAGIKLKGYASMVYFSACMLIFFALGNYFKNQVVQDEAVHLPLLFRSFAVVNLLVVSLGSLLILLQKQNKHQALQKQVLVLLFFVPVLLATISLFMASSHWFVVVLFVLFYFSHLAMPSAWLYFKADSPPAAAGDCFMHFCEQFEISKREAEIIREICLGKSNQAIADSLFITVQTVKDHAHRIYTKTGVKNRIQLSNLVNKKLKPINGQINA